jgi:hypothetical protein
VYDGACSLDHARLSTVSSPGFVAHTFCVFVPFQYVKTSIRTTATMLLLLMVIQGQDTFAETGCGGGQASQVYRVGAGVRRHCERRRCLGALEGHHPPIDAHHAGSGHYLYDLRSRLGTNDTMGLVWTVVFSPPNEWVFH